MTRSKAILALIVVISFGAACSTALASPPAPLAPADGASATAGTPIQFTASDSTAFTTDLTLQISSSPQTNPDGTLANPDLTDGIPNLMFGTGGEFSTTWTSSNRNAQTVYWVVYGFDCPAPMYTCINEAGPVRRLNVARLPLPEPVSPRSGATVVVGHDVAFTATDSTHAIGGLSLDISSSPATDPDGTLADPDIDSLTMSSSGSSYSAKSSSAADSIGSVYWVVYRFECNPAGCGNVASPIQTLNVVLPPVAVRIVGPVNFHLKHPAIRWSISCNVNCHGQAYVRAFVRKQGRNHRVALLSSRPASFNLKNAANYDDSFGVSYRGTSLRVLRGLVSRYGRVRFDIYVHATDAAGHSSAARRSLFMLPTPAPVHTPSRVPQSPAPTACYPLSNSGACYAPGEYCRENDHGVRGVAGDGEAIICVDNDGWRWEPV